MTALVTERFKWLRPSVLIWLEGTLKSVSREVKLDARIVVREVGETHILWIELFLFSFECHFNSHAVFVHNLVGQILNILLNGVILKIAADQTLHIIN